MATLAHLAPAISAHAWSGDGRQLALCPNSAEIWVLDGVDGPPAAWARRHTLRAHDMAVAALDWHAGTGRLVSVGHDRNAFVWAHDAATDSWSPTAVILHVARAALAVQWSPDGSRFAVASSDRQVVVCRFEAASNWWVSSGLRKAKSAVAGVSWHPSGLVVAACGTDFKCRLLAADWADEGAAAPPAPPPQFGPLPDLGAELLEFERSRAWVHDCCWSPSGAQLAFVSHDGQLHVVAFHPAAAQPPGVQSVRQRGLPATRVLFVSERALVVAGHAPTPELFTRAAAADGSWHSAGAVELSPPAAATTAAAAAAGLATTTSSFGSAKAVFAARVAAGSGGSGGVGAPSTAAATAGGSQPSQPHGGAVTHSGVVTSLQLLRRQRRPGGGSGGDAVVSTAATDGRVILWDLSQLVGLAPADAEALQAAAVGPPAGR